MNKYVKIISLLFFVTYVGLAQEQTNLNSSIFPEDIINPINPERPPKEIPVIRILPTEVEHGSVQKVVLQLGPKKHILAVRWTFTEAGAKRVLAFWEVHDGQKVRTEVGSYAYSGIIDAHSNPPGCTNISQWREGWLKHRTDKICVVSEDDAKKITEGLQGQ